MYDAFDPINPSMFYDLMSVLRKDNDGYEVKFFADVYQHVGKNVRFEGEHKELNIVQHTTVEIVQNGAQLIFTSLHLCDWNNFENLIKCLRETSFRYDLWFQITLQRFIAYPEMIIILDKLGFQLGREPHYQLKGEGYYGWWHLYL